MSQTLFIFRQDLRLTDHLGLQRAEEIGQPILPIFIRDSATIETFGRDDMRFAFIREALTRLSDEIQKNNGELRIYEGEVINIISSICQKEDISHIVVSASYNPHGRERDAQIRSWCIERGIVFESVTDYLILDPSEIPVRKVFTPFYRLWSARVESSISHEGVDADYHWGVWHHGAGSESISLESIHPLERHPYFDYQYLLSRLEHFDSMRYSETRDFPILDGSSRLSPYLRFGIVSPREVYRRYRDGAPGFIQELGWREFWYHITHYFPETYTTAFQEKRREITWENDAYLISKVERAETGYPLVDAAIRQLQTTGYMHNRLRMVVASFVTKNCLIDWRWGEAFFRRYLLDYDHSINALNWQWSASVGPDPKPLRIFNPLLQSERFDSEAKFIKKYLPELTSVSPKDIHTLHLDGRYHRPIVDQRVSTQRAKEVYTMR